MSDKNFCAAEDETRQRRREEGPTLFLLFSLFLIHFMGFICKIEVPVFHQITAWESESGVTDCDTCQVLILQKYKVMTVLFAESTGSEACCRLVCCLLVRRSQWSFCVLVQHYSRVFTLLINLDFTLFDYVTFPYQSFTSHKNKAGVPTDVETDVSTPDVTVWTVSVSVFQSRIDKESVRKHKPTAGTGGRSCICD